VSPRVWILAGLVAAGGLVAVGLWLFLNVAHTEGFWAFVGVIVGGLITATVSIGGELLRGWQGSRLDKDKRADDRWIERMRIQRDTLLELQERLTDWFETVRQRSYAEIESMHRTGEIGHTVYTEGTTFRESEGRLLYLVERVRDDGLRTALRHLREVVPAVEADHAAAEALTIDALLRDWTQIEDAYEAARNGLGKLLRTYL
jgi:hypothetical protein